MVAALGVEHSGTTYIGDSACTLTAPVCTFLHISPPWRASAAVTGKAGTKDSPVVTALGVVHSGTTYRGSSVLETVPVH